jgi:hypothetical protein
MSPAITGTAASSTLLRNCSIIGCDNSMPVTGTPRSAGGYDDAAGADGELQGPAIAGEVGEPVHGRTEHLRVEHASARRVTH